VTTGTWVLDDHRCAPPAPSAAGDVWLCPVCGLRWVLRTGTLQRHETT
jgi:hypothetical protein